MVSSVIDFKGVVPLRWPTRWTVLCLALLLSTSLLSGCAVWGDQRAYLVQQAIKTDLAGDFEGLKALYTPEHRDFVSARSTMAAVYRADAGGQTPDARHLKTTTVFSANDHAVVQASFDFYDSHKNHFVVTATYSLARYDKKWYILSYDSKKYLMP